MRVLVALAMLALAVAAASARADDPPASSAATWALADGPGLLARTQDFTFNFDEPGFYWLVERVARHDAPEQRTVRATDEPTPFKFLMERPSEFRGRLVVVEGVVQASQAYTMHPPGRGEMGPVVQSEISDPATGALCTVIAAGRTQPLAMRSRVRARGYFLKVRQYQTRTGGTAAAPLIVAHHVELVADGSAGGMVRRSRDWSSPQNMLFLATGVLAVVWILVRRATRRLPPARVPNVRHRHPTAAPPVEGFDELRPPSDDNGR